MHVYFVSKGKEEGCVCVCTCVMSESACVCIVRVETRGGLEDQRRY